MMFSGGFLTLLWKETYRFIKVPFQTLAAPVLMAYLYLLIFSHVLQTHEGLYYNKVSYAAFLVPGLAMMSILQNAWANSASSLIQSKITGNIIFLLLTPLKPIEIFSAYVLACVIRAVLVGVLVIGIGYFMTPLTIASPVWVMTFIVLGGVLFGCLGTVAGLWASRFDQLAALQNFLIVPMTFLSGVFYSIHSLSSFWQMASIIDPVFYLIDGLRYGFFAVSDVSPWISLWISLTGCILAAIWTWWLIRIGYKLRP